jgi:hypothetical protein
MSSIPVFGKVGAGRFSSLIGTGDVVAAAIGPDGTLRLVLDDDHGIALITRAYPHCTVP